MTVGRVHVGDVGTRYKLTVKDQVDASTQTPVNLADVDDMFMIFIKPSGETETKTASIFSPPGSDGTIFWDNTDASFVDEVGLWKRYAKLLYLDGDIYYSNSAEYQVIGAGDGD